MSVIFHLLLCLHCVCFFLGASFLSRGGMEILYLLSLFCVCEVAMAGLIETIAAGVSSVEARSFLQPTYFRNSYAPLECQICCKHCGSSLAQPNSLHFAKNCRRASVAPQFMLFAMWKAGGISTPLVVAGFSWKLVQCCERVCVWVAVRLWSAKIRQGSNFLRSFVFATRSRADVCNATGTSLL